MKRIKKMKVLAAAVVVAAIVITLAVVEVAAEAATIVDSRYE